MDFLQKPLAWFSKIYRRVQSKNCGRDSFVFVFLFRFFFEFWAKYFQTFGQKTSKICENKILRIQRNNLWLDFFKFWNVSDFLQKHLAWFSKFYLRVHRVKIAEKIVFFVFLSTNFSNFEQNFFTLLAKKVQKFVKTNFCVSTGTTCGFKFFSKGLNPFGFSAGTFGMFLKILSKCPE